ncbi:helix-turn-helix domain-containing protein [Streptomyces sp. N35]|uniref:helix-turn-helix domain-containing protein n=1 Tax=Streptomyces sp. N35 TaxID=2795730 RepID=UPI0018F47F72|nr:helix-turn-helix domain-containing protein [Streptomyces sp. N35]
MPYSQVVARLVRRARERRDPNAVAGFTAHYGPRTGRGLSQKEVAALADVSYSTYRRLESGKIQEYSDLFLEAVRRVLDLDYAEWTILYRLTHDHPPPMRTWTQRHDLTEHMRRLVQHLGLPACIEDQCFDIVTVNAAMLRYFPYMGDGINTMVWALTSPEARIQLIDWEHAWARPLIAQLRVQAEQNRTAERLREVVATVRANPTIADLWDTDLPVMAHPPRNDRRRMYLAGHGTTPYTITLVPFTPDNEPRWRLLIVTEADETE